MRQCYRLLKVDSKTELKIAVYLAHCTVPLDDLAVEPAKKLIQAQSYKAPHLMRSLREKQSGRQLHTAMHSNHSRLGKVSTPHSSVAFGQGGGHSGPRSGHRMLPQTGDGSQHHCLLPHRTPVAHHFDAVAVVQGSHLEGSENVRVIGRV